MQMGVKFKTTNNFDIFSVSRAKAKIDIKNDLKDIRANIIPKEPRKYRALKIF
jgi:IS4 transposase